MTDDTAFATADDVEDRGLALTPEQESVANQLCDDASDMIRSEWPDVDSRLASGELRAKSVTRVVASMVKRAMERALPEGAASGSQTAGPFATSVTLVAVASENLYLTKADRRLFDADGREPRAFAIDMRREPTFWDIPYCSPYWD